MNYKKNNGVDGGTGTVTGWRRTGRDDTPGPEALR
jgi:hypothetical protein